MLDFSIVIPNYNRRDKIIRAIESAKSWLSVVKNGEIVVVDDGSTDDSVLVIKTTFEKDVKNGLIRFFPLEKNRGVTGAKNYGASMSRGEWLVFLDSDDALIGETASKASTEILALESDVGLCFYRCRDMSDHTLIGSELLGSQAISLNDYMDWKFGECLPVIRRAVALEFPYEEKLLGAEGLSYMRQLSSNVGGMVSSIIMRECDRSGDDRLSSRIGLDIRGRQLARTHWIILKEFRHCINPYQAIKSIAKIGIWRFRYLRFMLLSALGLLHLLK